MAPHEAFLIGVVKDKPDITMPELADRLLVDRRVSADPAVLSRLLCGHGFTYKKSLMASKCARKDVREKRRVWITKRQPHMRLQPHRLVFIDGERDPWLSNAMNTTPLRSRSPKGARLDADAPFGH